MPREKQTIERRSPEFPCWAVISIEAETPEVWLAKLRDVLEIAEKAKRPLQGVFLGENHCVDTARFSWPGQ